MAKSGPLNGGQITINSYAYAVVSLHADKFVAWVNSGQWNRTVSDGGAVNLSIVTHVTKVAFPQLADLTIQVPLLNPGGTTPADCGSHGPGPPGGGHLIVVKDDGAGACSEAKTADHEFGHHLGFDDAYVGQTPPITAHCDITDVMSWNTPSAVSRGQK